MRVVFHLADRIMVLDQGKFLAEGTPQEIAANKAVQTAYLGQAA
jgi:branched-chain amino acid transport system ATP-binding protein